MYVRLQTKATFINLTLELLSYIRRILLTRWDLIAPQISSSSSSSSLFNDAFSASQTI
jgi:hypothetical protein